MKHVSKVSEPRLLNIDLSDKSYRPFVSASSSMMAQMTYGSSKTTHERGKRGNGYRPTVCIVKIDLFALHQAGLFYEGSFCNLSTNEKFEAYFDDAKRKFRN